MEKHCLLHDELHKDVTDNYSWDRCVFNNDSIFNPMSETLSSIEPYFEVNSPLSFWGTSSLDTESLKLDDVFQVEKDDLVQSPTLAELNANDESLLDSFDAVLPMQKKSLPAKLSVSTKSDEHYDNSAFKLSALNAIHINLSDGPPTSDKDCEADHKASAPKKYVEGKCIVLESQPSPKADKLQRVPKLSTSSSEIHMTSSDSYSMFEPSKRKSVDSTCELHADCLKFPCRETIQKDSDHLALSSGELEVDSEYEESEIECDYSSDVESDDEKRLTKDRIPSSVLFEKKKHRFFWQYNVQSKGPKGPKLKLNEDFPEISDPVFTDGSIKSVKHAGKARRGDGNDLTPNPKRLYHLGLELTKLNTIIDELVPVSEQPLNVRTKLRKEKNKLASRACRLKKKAQHEANKVKLFGLQQEQKHLQLVVSKTKKMIRNRLQVGIKNRSPSLEAAVISLSKNGSVPKVAGSSADFVNYTLKTVGQGDDTGGLNIPGKF